MNAQHQLALAAALLFGSCAGTPDHHHRSVEAWESLRDEHEAARQTTPQLAGATELSELLRHARLHNPRLEAAFERWRAALEEVPQVTKLPEPRLTLAGYAAELETRVGPMRAKASLMQPLPRAGELDAQGARAEALAEVARVELEDLRLELDAAVRDSWYERAWLAEAQSVSRGHLDLLVHWEAVARTRLESGLGSHADVIQAQVELGKLEDRVRSLEDLARPTDARLNEALGREPGAALPPAPRLPLEQRLPEEASLFAALAESPAQLAFHHRREATEQALEVARTSGAARWSLGAEYALIDAARTSGVSGSGDDALALVVGVDLPVWSSAYEAAEREQEARLRAVGRDQRASLDALGSQLELALYQLRDADRRAGLYTESLIPKGEEALRALDASYQSGEASFLRLVDAQRVLLEFQLEAVRARTDRARALARVERLTGSPLHTESNR
jgi:outer membrane protein TolC